MVKSFFNQTRFKKLWWQANPLNQSPRTLANCPSSGSGPSAGPSAGPSPDSPYPAYAAEMPVEGLDATERGSAPVKPAKPTAPEARPGLTAPAQPSRPTQPAPASPPTSPATGPRSSGPNPINGLVQRWRWPLVWLSALAVLGGMGTAALVWLVSLPPQIDCRNPSRLTLDMERLYCAQEAAQTGEITKLIAGIDLLKQWQPDHPLYREAQRLIEDWSKQVLEVAVDRVERGDLKGAEAALSHVPASTPVHEQVQASLGRWRKYSKRATGLYEQAQTALKQRQWQVVSQHIVLLAEFERDYWQLEKGADLVVQQLGAEKRSWQTLVRAQKLAATNNPQQLGAAIPMALQVPAKTYAAATARENLKTWSRKLLAVGEQKWRKGDRLGAISTLKLDPKIARTPEIADLYQFSHAYRLANSALSEYWLPSVGGLLNLKEAIAAISQVKPDSPFYAQAQALRQSWTAQFTDLTQLKYASASADLGNSSGVKLAVAQAQQIAAGRPRRVQAQSLVAFWNQELERLEDQPIVDQAIRLAKAGSIGALRAAIAEASQVELNRALRGRAQTLIATWRSQIQVLEDRPKLARAQTLADQGKLGQAIAAASEIQSGRALYREAQNAIADWQYQQVVNAQIAQDQPILDRANALANSGQLAAAIDQASRIGPGRALSSRAQSAINRWETQLNPPAPDPLPPGPAEAGLGEYQPELPQAAPSPEFPILPVDPLFPSPTGASRGTAIDPTSLPAFPSPTPELPREIQTVPPAATYEPYQPVPQAPPDAPLVPPAYEPLPPTDPLPPSRDPLPPGP